MRRATWIGAMVLVGSLFGVPAPAVADEACPPLDLTCEVTSVVGDAGGVIGETTDEVTGTVDEVVGQVEGIVNSPGDPGPGGGGGSDPGGHGDGDGDRRGRPDQRGRRSDQVPGPRPTSPSAVRVTGTGGVRPALSAGDPLAAAVAVAAKGLVALVVLSSIAAGFAAIQQRIDRGDPKLALAPVTSDVVEFA